MGRIRTKLIKNLSKQLHGEHADEFSKDFNENKKLVDKFADVPTKKMRNVIAGSVTRQKKQEA